MDNNTTCSINDHVDKYLFPVVYSIVIVIGIPVNCISLYVSCMQMRKKNELAIYLFSLSLADLFYCLILPLWIDYTSRGDNWRFSSLLCQISAFIIQTNFYTSAAFLTCISADRYLALVYPLRFQHLRSRRCALIISIFFWALETIVNSSVLTHKETFTNICTSGNHTICYDKYPMELWQIKLNIFRIITGYTIPLTIILFCYYKIYQVVSHNQATEDREKRKIKKLLLSITVTFIGCFTPYHTVLLIRSIEDSHHMYAIYRIMLALTSLNCITDPILYCFVSESGRTDILNLFKCCFSMQHTELSQPRTVVESKVVESQSLEVFKI
uniref:G protein-coupled receptor 65 n=1 Tax=Crocodylus porosus TaxID=8502 RepID=A0A7M4FUK4_CROPO